NEDKTTLLTAHVWNFSNVTTNSTIAGVISEIENFKLFLTNNTLSFSTNGTMTQISPEMTIEGWTVEADTSTSTWEFNTDETGIIFDKGTEEEIQQEIIKLTGTALELKVTEEDEEWGEFEFTHKWTK
ncbi:hypothetical protein ACFLSA_05980, partial [Bacteroidota bacterium]